MENVEQKQPQQIDVNELLGIIGSKEVQILLLSRRVKQLEEALKARDEK